MKKDYFFRNYSHQIRQCWMPAWAYFGWWHPGSPGSSTNLKVCLLPKWKLQSAFYALKKNNSLTQFCSYLLYNGDSKPLSSSLNKRRDLFTGRTNPSWGLLGWVSRPCTGLPQDSGQVGCIHVGGSNCTLILRPIKDKRTQLWKSPWRKWHAWKLLSLSTTDILK